MKRNTLLIAIFFSLSLVLLSPKPVYAACSLGTLSTQSIIASPVYDRNITLPNTIRIQNATTPFRNQTLFVYLVSLSNSYGEPLGQLPIDSSGNGQLQFSFANIDINRLQSGPAELRFGSQSVFSPSQACATYTTSITGQPPCLSLGATCDPNASATTTFCDAGAICNPTTRQVSMQQLSTYECTYRSGSCLECEISPSGQEIGCTNTTKAICLDKCEQQRVSGPNITCASGRGINTALGCIDVSNFSSLVRTILGILIGLGGGIALLLMGYGVFIVSTSAGIPDKVNEGKSIITAAAGGLLFVVLSVVLFQLIGVNILRLPGL